MATVVCVEYLMTTVVCEKYQMAPVVCDKYQMATIVRMTNDNPWCPGHQASQGSFPVLQYLMFYTQQGNTVLDILYHWAGFYYYMSIPYDLKYARGNKVVLLPTLQEKS